MRLSAALFLLPFAALAQTAQTPAPPPEVDQALRARVNEFFQYHVDGKFSKAFEMVAEDTKEYYFATQKVLFKSFKIESIKYSDDFTNAVVDLSGERLWKPNYDFPVIVVPVPMHTTWKIENGKWMWYEHSRPNQLMPFGPSDLSVLQKPAAADGMPDLSPTKMQERANAILQPPQQGVLDKSDLVLPLDKVSSEQVVFHNAQDGEVKLYLNDTGKVAGFTAELDKSTVGAGQSAVIKIHFDPKDAPQSPAAFTLRVVVEPFNREFPIAIKFAARQAAP